LAREAARWGLVFDPEPPYYLMHSDTFGAADMMRARRLAMANNLLHTFTFDSSILQQPPLLGLRPSHWLERFFAGSWRDGEPMSPGVVLFSLTWHPRSLQ
jgi:hypothetical protein